MLRTRTTTRTVLCALALFAAALIAACGGGGDAPAAAGSSSATPTKAEGVYEGTLSGSSSSKFQLLVLEDDEYWGLYGAQSGNTFMVAGFVQGQGASSFGQFSSTSGKDFGFATPASATVAASYVVGTSVSGTVTSAAGTATFTGTPIVPTFYNYDTPAVLSSVTGSWTVQALNGSIVALSIASNGAFTGTTSGCTLSGTLTPRASGKNVFDLALTFGAAPCAFPGTSGTGIALTYPTNTGGHQLVLAGVNSARTLGTAMFGVR